jgi:hypothetical protein
MRIVNRCVFGFIAWDKVIAEDFFEQFDSKNLLAAEFDAETR